VVRDIAGVVAGASQRAVQRAHRQWQIAAACGGALQRVSLLRRQRQAGEVAPDGADALGVASIIALRRRRLRALGGRAA